MDKEEIAMMIATIMALIGAIILFFLPLIIIVGGLMWRGAVYQYSVLFGG